MNSACYETTVDIPILFHISIKTCCELRLEPFFEIENHGSVFRNKKDRAKIVEGLRRAGLN
jgi:hypothetical protein